MDKNRIVSITEANQNFSKVAKMCREQGELYIFKNNKPCFILKDADIENDDVKLTDNEKVEIVGRRILKRYHKAFEELAK